MSGTLQGAAGFGFGLLAMPGFVWVLASVEAVPLVIVLSLIQSGALAVGLRGHAHWPLIARFALGAMIGLPAGLFVYGRADPDALMAMVAIVVLSSVLILARRPLAAADAREPGRAVDVGPDDDPSLRFRSVSSGGTGIIAGAMTIALGMPGPPVVLYLDALGCRKDMMRATVLTFLTVAYGSALFAQVGAFGVGSRVWGAAAALLPVVFLGGWIGNRLSRHIDEVRFRRCALGLIAVTGLAALVSALMA